MPFFQEEEWKEYTELTFSELLERLNKSYDKDGNILNKKDYFHIPQYLAWLFSFVTTGDLNSELDEFEKRLEKLEDELRNHRHGILGVFTDTPAGRR